MNMTNPEPRESIVNLLRQQAVLGNPDHLVLSAVPTNEYYELYHIHSDEGDFMLRIAYPEAEQAIFYEADMMRREVALMDLLRQETEIPIADTVVVDFEHNHINRDYLITTMMPRSDYSEMETISHEHLDKVYLRLGKYLSQIHAISGSHFGYYATETADVLETSWKNTFKDIWQRLITDVADCGLYTKGESSAMIDLLDEYGAYFDHDLAPTLLQMDIRKENIIVDKAGDVAGLLGFGTAMWGDPELEFAALDCAGIWGSAFWDGYGSARPNDLGSRTRQKFYILFDVQKNILLYLKRKQNLAEAEQYKQTALTISSNLAASTP